VDASYQRYQTLSLCVSVCAFSTNTLSGYRRMAVDSDLWVFGYGSLIFRPDFPFVARREGFITDWSRRFWQASPDHRGTPELPGRVATIVASPGARCWGVAYGVAAEERERVLAYLDERECGGYERRMLPFHTHGGEPLASVLVYIADHGNPNFVADEDVSTIAARIRAACGLRGPNLDYVLHLATALANMGADDPHVFELARALDLCLDYAAEYATTG
jgi:cation transport regulator ChaC